MYYSLWNFPTLVTRSCCNRWRVDLVAFSCLSRALAWSLSSISAEQHTSPPLLMPPHDLNSRAVKKEKKKIYIRIKVEKKRKIIIYISMWIILFSCWFGWNLRWKYWKIVDIFVYIYVQLAKQFIVHIEGIENRFLWWNEKQSIKKNVKKVSVVYFFSSTASFILDLFLSHNSLLLEKIGLSRGKSLCFLFSSVRETLTWHDVINFPRSPHWDFFHQE